MKYKDKVRSYFLEDKFKLIYIENKINIVNYDSIGHFDSNKIIVRKETGTIIVNGTNLVVSKLVNDEILIDGKISSVEFR